jgi:RHS repeat-associated protein
MTSHLYIHGPGIDEPLEVYHGTGETWYYHADGLGSIVRVTDEDGQFVPAVARQYDAFGNLQVGGAYEGYAFTGREWDPETGLYYYRARYYDPKIGRFISEDPIGFEAGINFYAYVSNNPVNWVDPFGLQAIQCVPLPNPCTKGPCIGPNPSPTPRPTPTPTCIGKSPCPCGYEPVPDPSAGGLCWLTLGNVPTVGTAASGQGTPQTGMAGPAQARAGTAGPPNTGGTAPGVPNTGGAAGGGMAGLTASLPFCANVGIKCVPKSR